MIQLGNAAGWLKRPGDIDDILKLPNDIVSFVVLGSYTLEERRGNPEPNFAEFINSRGLPGPGIKESRAFLPDMIFRIKAAGKRAIISIAGFAVEEYKRLAASMAECQPDEIEVNLGCPNVWKDGSQKPIASFAPELVRQIIDAVYSVTDHPDAPELSYKVSPYSDPLQLGHIAEIMREKQHAVDGIVTCNTFPNAYGFETSTGKPLIAQGYGGLSGPAMKHIALGQAMQWRKALPDGLATIICGGIASGRDLRDAELAEAARAQVGTAFFLGGARALYQVAEQYAHLAEID